MKTNFISSKAKYFTFIYAISAVVRVVWCLNFGLNHGKNVIQCA